MSDTRNVISAFLDDEPFDQGELAEALSEPESRDVLIDLIALRHLVQPVGAEPPAMPTQRRRRSAWQLSVAAAAVLVALAGGYLAGARRSDSHVDDPPAATRVVEASAEWQDVPAGRLP